MLESNGYIFYLLKLFWSGQKKYSACGGQTASATLCLRKKTFSHRPRKPPNPVPCPYTGARYPVSGPVHYLCFGKLGTGEGIFLTLAGERTHPWGFEPCTRECRPDILTNRYEEKFRDTGRVILFNRRKITSNNILSRATGN